MLVALDDGTTEIADVPSDGTPSDLTRAQTDQLLSVGVQTTLDSDSNNAALASAENQIAALGAVPAPAPDLTPPTIASAGTLGADVTASGDLLVAAAPVTLTNTTAYQPPTFAEIAAMTDAQAMAAIAELHRQHPDTQWTGGDPSKFFTLEDEQLEQYANNAHGPTTIPAVKALVTHPWWVAHLGTPINTATETIPADVVTLMKAVPEIFNEFFDPAKFQADATVQLAKDQAAQAQFAAAQGESYLVNGQTYHSLDEAIAAQTAADAPQDPPTPAPTAGAQVLDRLPNAPVVKLQAPPPSAAAPASTSSTTALETAGVQLPTEKANTPIIILIALIAVVLGVIFGVLRLPKVAAGGVA